MERRLAAILIADVVNYSRLMGEDEARTLAALAELRKELFEPVVAGRGGKVIKRMGDGWIVEFPNVSDAVTSAIEVQAGLADHEVIRLRIGVHTGDVTFQDDDIYGDGINVAARLEALAEPGQVLISDTAHHSLDGKAAKQFSGGQTQQLKNIERPVAVWQWPATSDATVKEPAALALPDKPSIAVLPFDNLSRDPEQDYFSDGVTEDIITELARFAEFHVIARNSTFAYKGKRVDPTEVAQDLGVSYVLEGSIRRSGNRLRISAQLIDGSTGNHHWAERYDRNLDDIFELQDEITRTIAGALGAKIRDINWTQATRNQSTNINAYDLILRAWPIFYRFNKRDNLEARRLGEQAEALSPDSVEAQVLLAWTHYVDVRNIWSTDPAGALEMADKLSKRAVFLDDRSYDAHMILGICEVWQGHHERGIESLKKAIQLNPNFANAHAHLADAYNFAGRPEEALPNIETAVLLNPRFPAFYGTILARTQFALQNHEEVERICRNVINSVPSAPMSRSMLAASLVAIGRQEEAKAEVREMIAVNPDYTIANIPISLPYRDPKDLEQLLYALRQAGVPE